MAYVDSGNTFPTVSGDTMTDISFAPTSLALSVGTNSTFFANLTMKETIVSASWFASPTGVTQLNITKKNESEYGATFEIDTSRAQDSERGDILVTVEGQYEKTNGGYARFERSGLLPYVLRVAIDPDIPPIDSGSTGESGTTVPMENNIQFDPVTLSFSAGTSGWVNTVMTSNKNISSATWTAEDLNNNGITISVNQLDNYRTTTTLGAGNLTGATSGTVRFNVTGKYLENAAKNFSDSFLYSYNILKKVVVDSDPVMSLSKSSVSLPANTSTAITATVSMDEQIITTDWTASYTGSQLIHTLEDNTSTSVKIKLDSSNLTADESGTITVTANVLYLSGDGTQKRKTVSKKITYTAKAPEPDPTPDPDPTPETGVKGDLSASTTKVVITKSPKVVTINSSENVVEWTYTENQLLTITKTETGYTYANFEIAPKTYGKDDATIAVFRAYYDTGKTLYTEIVVNVEMQSNKIIPVWQNNLIELDSSLGNRVEYTLVDIDTNEVIYSGKVNKLPNGDTIGIDVTKIVGNYLKNPFPYITLNTTNVFSINDYSKTVDIKVGGNIVETVTVYNSWGYKDLPYSNIISDPIRKVADRRQFFVCSVYNPTAIFKNVEYRLTNGTDSLYKYGISATHKKQTILIDGTLRNYPQYNKLKVGNLTYDIIESCAEWCLYYSNAYGGWDSLLINGNSKKTDNISSQYYVQSYNNNTYQFEKTKYLNVITPKYVLYTDYFNDDEQSRFHHLLESTEVYLHNLNTNEILPVNITNTSCDYTTFTNNGKKKWYNTINVEVAQERIRK